MSDPVTTDRRRLGRPLALFVLLGMLAMGGLAPSASGQQALLGASPSASDYKSDHANRCLAAIDLAIMSAENGAVDVSIEAMRRACRQGPPVASIQLGDILGSAQQSSSLRSSSSRTNESSDSTQQRISQRLQDLQGVWKKVEIDPEKAYGAWKEVVFPPDRPNEGFAYSTLGPASNSMSYSNFWTETKVPERAKSGAESLVEWARKADQLDDLNSLLDARRQLPGAADTVLLIDILLATSDDIANEEAEALCERMTSRMATIVNSSHAELLLGFAWELVEKLGDDSPAARDLIDALLQEISSKSHWGANAWFRYIVASNLQKAIESGEVERFDQAVQLAMTYYDDIRRGNESYVSSRESTLYSMAAQRAFEKGNTQLGASCVQRLVMYPSNSRYGGLDMWQLADPGHSIMQGLMGLTPQQRLDSIGELAWNLPALGVHDSSHLTPTDHIPALFLDAANGPRNPPTQGITGADRVCLTLIEWTMREQLAAGNEEQILKRIAELDAQQSDDADLARVMLLLAKDEPLPAELLTRTRDNGKVELRVPAMDPSRVKHFDTEIMRQALMNADLNELATKVVEQRIAVTKDRMQGDEIAWLRGLQMLYAENQNARTDASLAHWVVSCDYHTGDMRDGRYPRSTWVEREPGRWGHQTGPNLSYLLLRYPLEGDYSLSFRHKDSGWEEGGASLGGMVSEFLGHEGRFVFRGISERGERDQKTDVITEGDWNQYRIDCKAGKIQLTVGDDELQTELGDFQQTFPFLGMQSYSFRSTTFDQVEITGDYQIPRQVELIGPLLIGWSAKFYQGSLPEVEMTEERSLVAKEVEQPRWQWGFHEGEIRSINLAELEGMEDYEEQRREAVLQYLRPLYSGEQISLEFYYEPGKFQLTPTLGRIGMLLESDQVALHWLTGNNTPWTGVEVDNRVLDPAAEQLTPPTLKPGEWNEMQIALDGDTVTLTLNGTPIYRRTWEQGTDRRFGLFHDPTSYHVRVRNVKLSGDWPEELPSDLFEQTGAGQP